MEIVPSEATLGASIYAVNLHHLQSSFWPFGTSTHNGNRGHQA